MGHTKESLQRDIDRLRAALSAAETMLEAMNRFERLEAADSANSREFATSGSGEVVHALPDAIDAILSESDRALDLPEICRRLRVGPHFARGETGHNVVAASLARRGASRGWIRCGSLRHFRWGKDGARSGDDVRAFGVVPVVPRNRKEVA